MPGLSESPISILEDIKPKDISAGQIVECLLGRYSEEKGWASFVEVEIGSRIVDFIAVSCWRDAVHVFEIKVSRNDFLREMKDYTKRRPAYDNSTKAYFIMPQGIAELEEIPEDWGYIVCTNNLSLKTIREPDSRPMPMIQTKIAGRLLSRASAPVDPAKRVYIKYEGETITPGELERLVERKFDTEVFRRMNRRVATQLKEMCYCCNSGSEILHQEILSRLDRMVEQNGHEADRRQANAGEDR